jgi:hypothetical protein
MPKYQFYLTETTTVYKEIEADSPEQAEEIAVEFMYSDHIDWGMGDMQYRIESQREIQDA